MTDDWKEMTSTTTKTFNFNDGEDLFYKVTAYADCVELEYVEFGEVKQKIYIPTWVVSRMFPVIAEMAKEVE